METYWEYDGCDLDDERQIERCWERVLPGLEANLESLPDPATELRMAINHHDEAPEWRINAALHVPGRTLAVEATANDIETAMDDLLVGLSGEIDILQDVPVRVTRRMDGLEAILPFLDTSHRQDRRDAFLSFLSPVVASLASYVHRELQLREIEGALPGMELSTPDVLDEVLFQAWQQFDKRPPELSLNAWIMRLIDQVIERFCEGRITESLDDELQMPSTEPPPSQREYWLEQTTYPETIELHELLSGAPEGDVWDDTDLDIKQENFAQLLAGIPRQQRQALLLYAVHGFSEAEIADFQDRPQDEVEHDIEAAKENLAQQLAEG